MEMENPALMCVFIHILFMYFSLEHLSSGVLDILFLLKTHLGLGEVRLQSSQRAPAHI